MTSLVSGRGNLRLVPGVALRPPRARRVLSLVERVELWAQRHRERRALMQAPDLLLKDLGLSRADAAREGDKPFWRG
ncbi:DUF1127 domain-containing protein [Methylobacterium oryzisoli]|uniref:DUF1127 domain-containing protein n=1 Tax=Methylobacterium oryzisoli TaxID=3385502 RepID=UPI0038927C11